MHKQFYNEAIFTLSLRPISPLLIKSGSSEETLDPTLPDMSFVRMQRAGQAEPHVYIPGSSLRGVLRAHAERLLRSIEEARPHSGAKRLACDPTSTGMGGTACFSGKDTTAVDGDEAYLESCYACKLFGNMALASRVRVGDLYPDPSIDPLLERRYGVAIDRITGAVAQGPFELEILTDARFNGRLTARNFTIGQFGLLAAVLLDLGEGLVPIGYGKSRGLGRVELTFDDLTIRNLRPPEGVIHGVGSLAGAETRLAYQLPDPEPDRLEVGAAAIEHRGFHTLRADATTAREWLDRAAMRWVPEVIG